MSNFPQVDRVNATQNIVKEVGINHAVIQTSGTIKFLDQDPVQILKLGKYLKVPIITGVTKDEGSMILDCKVILNISIYFILCVHNYTNI